MWASTSRSSVASSTSNPVPASGAGPCSRSRISAGEARVSAGHSRTPATRSTSRSTMRYPVARIVSGSSASGSSIRRNSPVLRPGQPSSPPARQQAAWLGAEPMASATVHSASSAWMSGTPGHLQREQRDPRGPPADAAAGSERAEQHPDRPGVVGQHQPPGGQVVGVLAAAEALAALRAAQPDLPFQPVGVERPHRHAGLHHRDRERVVEHRARREAAGLQPLERQRLDRRAVLVGVEPDVAEEDAVGVRDRLAPQLDRLRAAEAAREHAQPLAEPRRARPGARLRACARAGGGPGTPPRCPAR